MTREHAARRAGVRRTGRSLVAVVSLALAGSACRGDFDEGDVTLAVSGDGRLMAGVFACGLSDAEPPPEAFLYRITGDRDQPQELLWRGTYVGGPAAIPLSDIDVFALYATVEGPVLGGDDFSELDGSTVISLVLDGHGGHLAPLAELREQPGLYLSDGDAGTFGELREVFCRVD